MPASAQAMALRDESGSNRKKSTFFVETNLCHGEEEREVAVDVVLGLKLPGGLDALPGGAELDQHALLGNALLGVELDQPLGLGNLYGDYVRFSVSFG